MEYNFLSRISLICDYLQIEIDGLSEVKSGEIYFRIFRFYNGCFELELLFDKRIDAVASNIRIFRNGAENPEWHYARNIYHIFDYGNCVEMDIKKPEIFIEEFDTAIFDEISKFRNLIDFLRMNELPPVVVDYFSYGVNVGFSLRKKSDYGDSALN